MKVIFLDIDGVMTSFASLERFRSAKNFDPISVTNLNKLTDKSGAVIVISSTWRLLNKFQWIASWMKKEGVTGSVVGLTPDFRDQASELEKRRRGAEIQAWLDTHPDVTSFVILDDDRDMGPLLPKLVHTSFETGLTQEHVDHALELLDE